MVLVCVALLIAASACGPTAPVPDLGPTGTASDEGSLTARTETALPPSEEVAPTEVRPTSSPIAPPGTIRLIGDYGYGGGEPFWRRGMQLSPDEQTLIVTTTAGVFTFSAADLAPRLAIREAAGFYPSYRNIRVSRDGRRAVSLSQAPNFDLVLRLWDLESGDLLGEHVAVPEQEMGVDGSLVEVAITPDGQQAALVFQNGAIRVVRLADGGLVRKVGEYVGFVETPYFLEFDPEGDFAYFIFRDIESDQQSIELSTRTWEESSLSAGSIRPVGAFSPRRSESGFTFGYYPTNADPASGSFVLAQDYSTLFTRFKMERETAVSAIAFSPDGMKVAIAARDPAALEVWQVDAIDSPEQTFSAPAELWTVATTSDGSASYGIAQDGTLYKWESGQPDPVASRAGFWPIATGLEYADDGQTLRLFTDDVFTIDNEVFELDPLDGSLKQIRPNPYVLPEMKDEYPQALAVSPDGSSLALVYPVWVDRQIRLFDWTTGKFLRTIPTSNDLENLDFTPDGSLITYSLPDGPVQVLDVDDGRVLHELSTDGLFESGVAEMRLSGDRSTMFLAGWGGELSAYNTETFDPIQTLDDSALAFAFAVSPDGTRAAVLGWDGALRIWDVPTNEIHSAFDLGYGSAIDPVVKPPHMAFSPDGRQLALTTWDGLIRVFDIAP